MAYDAYEQRLGLSFEQAEGVDPLPSQLQRTELTKVFRARIWEFFALIIEKNHGFSGSNFVMTDPWDVIARDELVYRHGGFIDRSSETKNVTENRFKSIIQTGDYLKVYGLIQFILQHRKCPKYFPTAIGVILEEQLSAYRVVGGNTLVPIASAEVAGAVNNALTVSEDTQFKGAHTHLRQAAAELGEGNFANSVRESISAVESIARVLEPTADLSKALGRLEKSGHLHKAMKHGFSSLYGWTSDESGIRHALLEDGDANVDEVDAIFMIGACASFVTYLIAKKRSAGIESS